MLNEKIKFEEKYTNKKYETTTYYFTAPKKILNEFYCTRDKYPEATSVKISIEFPTTLPEAQHASVQISPTIYSEEVRGDVDYDWTDVELAYEETEWLIEVAEKEIKKQEEIKMYKIGDVIENVSVGKFTVVSINKELDRVLLVSNYETTNRYVGVYGLQKTQNDKGYIWAQGHYFSLFESAVSYVLGKEDNKRKMYIVICCIKREIYKIGESTDKNEATQIMVDDFMKAFKEDYELQDFYEEVDKDDQWGLSSTDAWINANCGDVNMDWKIIDVEVA